MIKPILKLPDGTVAPDNWLEQQVPGGGSGSLQRIQISDLLSVSALTTTLAMTDGVVTGIFPAVEPGVPDDWRFDFAAPWYTELRNTGSNLGEYANLTTAEVVAAAAVNDYYYNKTSHTYRELDDLGGTDHEIFRAGSAEFPAMPGFSVRSAKLIDIYDMKDGSLWARIEGNASDLINNNGTIGKIAYRNGVLAVASSVGVFIVDFKDGGSLRFYTATNVSKYDGTWAQRNDGNGYVVISTDPILANNVKAVAIGDASKPIGGQPGYGKDDWGVPRQYVGVGTDTTDGFSIIHPPGDVYDGNTFTDPVASIAFNDFGEVLVQGDTTQEIYVYDIPFRDVSPTDYIRIMESTDVGSGTAAEFPHVWNPDGGQVDSITTLDGLILASSVNGSLGTTVTVINEDVYGEGDDDGRDSLAAYPTYDSVLAEHTVPALVDRLVTGSYGSETGTSDLVEGSNLVANGAAWTGATGTTPPNSWATTGSTATYTISSGALIIDRNAEATDSAADITQTLTTVEGQAYLLRISIDARSHSVVVTVQGTESTYTSTGIKFIPFIADDATTEVRIRTDANNGATATIDDVEANLAVQDRSPRNTDHAKINGTTTRAAYDSGDVVLHSGADALSANAGAYWEIGADRFVTDGEIFHQWIDYTATEVRNLQSNRALNGSDDPITWLADNTAGSALYIHSDSRLYVRDGTGSANTATALSTAMATGLHEIRVILSSTDIYVYIDGKLDQVTASVTLTAPTDAITYIHPSNSTFFRVGGIDRKGTALYYKWTYDKERRLFDNGAEATLQGTGNIVDISVDPIRKRKTFTVLQTDHWTEFSQHNIVVADGAVSNTGVSVSTYDGDISILDGANLTLITRARSISNHLVHGDRVRGKHTIEKDSLLASQMGIFGLAWSQAPDGSGTTVGDTLAYAGSPTGTVTNVADGMLTLFDDEAGSYLVTHTVSGFIASTIALGFSGTVGTTRGSDATFAETLTYDPAANANDDIVYTYTSSTDLDVSDYRIRRVGVPFWIPKGWRPETIWEDGSKVRPDTGDLTRDGAIVHRFDGSWGWESTTDTWNTLSIELVEE